MKSSHRGSSFFLKVQRFLLVVILSTVFVLTLILCAHLSSKASLLQASHPHISFDSAVEAPLRQKYEDNNGTYGRCITAYQDTLKGGRFVQGKSVWIDSHGVDLLCSLLQPHMKVLEFGSGGSTSLFSQFVMHWDSVEHNKMWADKMMKTMKNVKNVDIFTVANDLPYKEWAEDGSEKQFQHYINFPATLGRQYDLIFNDGRARLAVGKSVLTNRHGVLDILGMKGIKFNPFLREVKQSTLEFGFRDSYA